MSFSRARNDLSANGVVWIGGIDEVEEVGSDREGEFFVGEPTASAFVRVELKVLL